MVTRTDQKNWTISTVDGANDIAMMAYNNPATLKTPIGLKKMPFGLSVYCQNCPLQ